MNKKLKGKIYAVWFTAASVCYDPPYQEGQCTVRLFFPPRFLFFPLHFLSSSECSTSKRSIQTLNLYLYDWR
jgi:hypothetical protein